MVLNLKLYQLTRSGKHANVIQLISKLGLDKRRPTGKPTALLLRERCLRYQGDSEVQSMIHIFKGLWILQVHILQLELVIMHSLSLLFQPKDCCRYIKPQRVQYATGSAVHWIMFQQKMRQSQPSLAPFKCMFSQRSV